MGQRSQIYVRVNDKKGKKHLIAARYFQWNYGTRMVSRARYTIEWLKNGYEAYFEWFIPRYLYSKDCENEYRKKLTHIIETNFDYKDVVLSADILKEFEEYAEEKSQEEFKGWVFTGQDNNDGKFILDIEVDYSKRDEEFNYLYKMKYSFLDCSCENPMDALQYMNWDEEDWENNELENEVNYTKENAKYISENASLMTDEEIKEFINYDYTSSMEFELVK